MIYNIEYTIKNLNKEKYIKQLMQFCNLKNVKTKEGEFCFSVPYGSKNKVEKFFADKEISILKKEKKGLIPFLTKTILRLGVVVPIVAFFVFVCILNCFVFQYKIIGINLIPKEQIEKVLDSQHAVGIVSKRKINTKEIENAILDIDKVSLVSVIIQGNTLIVNIKEKVYNQEYEEKDSFLPLTSKFNGQITELDVVQGTPLVKVGQIVRVGQQLVAPYVINTNGEKLMIKPMAEIKADVYLSTITEVPNVKIEMKDTGKKQESKSISLFGQNIYHSGENCSFKHYRKEESSTDISGGVLLPIKVTLTTFYEQEEVVQNNFFSSNKDQILTDCRQKTRQLVGSCEIIKEEYETITEVADLNQITCTVVVNKSLL